MRLGGWLLLAAGIACGTGKTPPEAPAPPPADAPAPPPPAPPPAPTGPPLPVPDAMALGDCPSVLRSLGEPAGEGLQATAQRLAVATCRLRGGDAAGAVAALDGPDTTELAGYRRLLRARAEIALDRGDAALADLDGLTLPGAAGREAQLLRGTIRADRGDAAAKADLTALVSTDVGPEARFGLATLAGKSGDAAGEVAALRELWLDVRPGGWDAKAAERLAAVGSEVPDLATPAGRALARKRLAALSSAARASEAVTLANDLAAAEPPPDQAAWDLLGRARYNARDYKGALEAWRSAFGPPESADGSASQLFDYALCHARAGDYDTAAVVYRRVIAKYPKTTEGDFASFKLGYMRYDRLECPAAVAEFAEHRGRYPDSKHLDEMLWFTARCAWKAGDRAGAAAAWAELETARPKSSLVPGAAYWRARAVGLGGDAAGERAGLEAVVSKHPTSGYAYLAAERLERTFPARLPVQPPPWPEGLAGRPEVARADALLAVGLRRWASGELGALPDPTDRAGALALGWARLRAGDVIGAKKLGCKLAESPWKSGDPLAQQLCTPRPEPAMVDRYTKDFDPAVVYGVMVAESNLDPAVSSAVGARGLMQLMPDLADELHAELFPGRPYAPDDLFSAPYNVALGATELSQKAASLRGVLTPSAVPAVVASYNGGEDAVRRWIGDAKAPPSDEFTEDIGFVETRGYVKRVLGFAMAYRWVYGDAR